MIYTTYELLWCFLIYSFLGWCLEVIAAAAGRKKFVNRGLLNGILCPIYGFSVVFMLVFMDSLKNGWFYLFLGCAVVGSVIELLTGLTLEKVFQMRLWDYSKRRFQIGGYVCLAYSVIWGLLGLGIIKFFNPLLIRLISIVPHLPGVIMLAAAWGLLAADTFTTVAALLKIKNQNQKMTEIAQGFTKASRSLRSVIVKWVDRRMNKAFPELKKKEQEEVEKEAQLKKQIFAYGCSFHKIVWIFFLGAFLGDITETIYCLITTRVLMSRSSVVYGPFSLVWGIGVAGATILLYRYRDKEDRYIFLAGTLLGGVYEYICSVFTELAFGTVFWDYSEIPFNLGGRINLLYCFFWGMAALVWIKLLYPRISDWIEKVPRKPGRIITYVFVVFMSVNMVISALALARYSERAMGSPAKHKVSEWLDEHFPDSRMERIYPNAKMTEP